MKDIISQLRFLKVSEIVLMSACFPSRNAVMTEVGLERGVKYSLCLQIQAGVFKSVEISLAVKKCFLCFRCGC